MFVHIGIHLYLLYILSSALHLYQIMDTQLANKFLQYYLLRWVVAFVLIIGH